MSRRIVLLGASNLNMGLPRLMRAFRVGFPGALDVFGALGHGRSFGIWSRVLHRALPGIAHCGLWEALERRGPAPDETLALITDVGNDLLYGIDAPQIAAWVETCLERLNGPGVQIVLTGLPMDNVARLKAWRYYATRAMFFPKSEVSFEQMQKRAADLNRRIQDLGEHHGATVIGLPGEWYSIDPIHFRHTRRRQAWQTILSSWPSFPEQTPTGAASPAAWFRFARRQPQLRRVLGREHSTEQPVYQSENICLSLY